MDSTELGPRDFHVQAIKSAREHLKAVQGYLDAAEQYFTAALHEVALPQADERHKYVIAWLDDAEFAKLSEARRQRLAARLATEKP